MENTISVFDLPEDCEITVSFGGHGLYFARLLRGSPLRTLLENQQTFQEAFDAGRQFVRENPDEVSRNTPLLAELKDKGKK